MSLSTWHIRWRRITFIRYWLTRLVLWLLLYTHGISSCARPRLCTWAMSSFLWFMHLVCWKPCVITAHKEFKLVRCIQPGWVIGLYISLQDRVHHAALQACTGCVQRSVNPGCFFGGGGEDLHQRLALLTWLCWLMGQNRISSECEGLILVRRLFCYLFLPGSSSCSPTHRPRSSISCLFLQTRAAFEVRNFTRGDFFFFAWTSNVCLEACLTRGDLSLHVSVKTLFSIA